MIGFEYARATDVADAVRQMAAHPGARFVAGGTNLLDLMKEDVERPTRLIDITRLPLKDVAETPDGGLRIGALVPNSDLAWHPLVERRYPILASAILAGASQQLRNMASTGGNLLQRTRCYYFYDTAAPCNKREPGSGCSAIDGLNRMHAILGASDACIAVHPSDMCVALAVLDATVHVAGPQGERTIAFADFHRLPGDEPQRDTNLAPDEIVTAVELPPRGFAANHTYLKIRDRLSYAFALVSVAAALELDGGTVREARLGLGFRQAEDLAAEDPWRRQREAAADLGRHQLEEHRLELARHSREGDGEAERRRHQAARRQADGVQEHLRTGHHLGLLPEIGRHVLVARPALARARTRRARLRSAASPLADGCRRAPRAPRNRRERASGRRGAADRAPDRARAGAGALPGHCRRRRCACPSRARGARRARGWWRCRRPPAPAVRSSRVCAWPVARPAAAAAA